MFPPARVRLNSERKKEATKVSSQLTKLLRYYRVIFFWLVMALGIVLGTNPVVASVTLVLFAAIAVYIHSSGSAPVDTP